MGGDDGLDDIVGELDLLGPDEDNDDDDHRCGWLDRGLKVSRVVTISMHTCASVLHSFCDESYSSLVRYSKIIGLRGL